MFKLPHYTSDIMVLKKFTPPIVVLVEILIVLPIKLGLFSTFCTSALLLIVIQVYTAMSTFLLFSFSI